MNESNAKCDQFWSDYQVYYDENNRLKNFLHTIKEQKDNALAEINWLKTNHFTDLETTETNLKEKIDQLNSILASERESHKVKESESYEVVWKQELLIAKWKHEMQKSVDYFQRLIA